MKIVFIIDQVYKHGGIERVLSVKANYLAQNTNHEIHIVTHEQQGKASCYDFDQAITFTDLGINYDRLKSYFHPKNLLKVPKHILKISSFLKKTNPEVVVVCSHTTDTYFMPFVVKRIPKIKEFHYSKFIELSIRKQPTSRFKKYFLKFADYVESKYDKLVVLNKDEATYYKTNNVAIIPNPLTFFPNSISNVGAKVVITAGRIAPVKGYDILIDIWAMVAEKFPDWQLHIYGEGNAPAIQTLKDQILKLNLTESVILKGITNTIQDKMLNSSIFVMSSHNECFPLVLLEAKACGLPIVSFDCPHGPANIINANDGRLVPLYDTTAFANQMIELMGNQELRKQLGEQARNNVVKFKTAHIMETWEALFYELAETKAS